MARMPCPSSAPSRARLDEGLNGYLESLICLVGGRVLGDPIAQMRCQIARKLSIADGALLWIGPRGIGDNASGAS